MATLIVVIVKKSEGNSTFDLLRSLGIQGPVAITVFFFTIIL